MSTDLIEGAKMFDLHGKVAVVIGGSGILGGAMANALASVGADVAVLYNSNADGAADRVAQIQKYGVNARVFQCDTTNKADLVKVCSDIMDEWERIDILLNAPGINSATPVLEIESDEWQRIMDVNLKGVFLACQVFGEAMIKAGNGGSIINVSSVTSTTPLSKVFTYSISKHGVNGLTKFLAREWAPHNIRVNAIAPGFFPAEQNRKILTKERQASIFGHTPMHRYGEAEELAGATIWLASEKAASFVTGAIIPVDGGFTAMTI